MIYLIWPMYASLHILIARAERTATQALSSKSRAYSNTSIIEQEQSVQQHKHYRHTLGGARADSGRKYTDRLALVSITQRSLHFRPERYIGGVLRQGVPRCPEM